MNKGANGEREGATVVEERREEGREGRGRDEGGGGVTRCRINSDVTSTVPTPTCDRSDSDTSARCACVCGRLDVYKQTYRHDTTSVQTISPKEGGTALS